MFMQVLSSAPATTGLSFAPRSECCCVCWGVISKLTLRCAFFKNQVLFAASLEASHVHIIYFAEL